MATASAVESPQCAWMQLGAQLLQLGHCSLAQPTHPGQCAQGRGGVATPRERVLNRDAARKAPWVGAWLSGRALQLNLIAAIRHACLPKLGLLSHGHVVCASFCASLRLCNSSALAGKGQRRFDTNRFVSKSKHLPLGTGNVAPRLARPSSTVAPKPRRRKMR